MTTEANGWQRWALGITVGVLLGGGGSAIYGNAQAKAIEARLQDDIAALEVREDKNFEIILKMSDSIARMETQLEYIAKKVE